MTERFLERIHEATALMQEKVLTFLPEILSALAIVIVGIAAAWVLKAVSQRLLSRIGNMFPKKFQQSSGGFGLARGFPELIGTLIFWGTLLFVIGVASDVVGLPIVPNWLETISGYLPKLFVAIFIAFVGIVSANFFKDATVRWASSASLAYPILLGKAAQVSVLLFTVIVVVGQLGIDVGFVSLVALIVLGSFLGAGALSFGFGARSVVENILAAHYIKKQYSVGQKIKIQQLQGTIIEITTTSLIIESSEGQYMIPAKQFLNTESILIEGGSAA